MMSLLKAYDIVRRPVITEKSTVLSAENKVVFEVSIDASKPEIKKAVEELFKVKVESVNTIRTQGKTKRFRGRLGKRSDRKKAIITLQEGQTIDMAVGV
ncbi:50S ribosomal protein L23 [bacterium]|nr:50S ribosomal protein L23 [bacterium]